MRSKNDPLSANGTVAVGVLTLIVLLGAGGTSATLTRISGAIIASGRIEVAQTDRLFNTQMVAWSPKLPLKKGHGSTLAAP